MGRPYEHTKHSSFQVSSQLSLARCLILILYSNTVQFYQRYNQHSQVNERNFRHHYSYYNVSVFLRALCQYVSQPLRANQRDRRLAGNWFHKMPNQNALLLRGDGARVRKRYSGSIGRNDDWLHDDAPREAYNGIESYIFLPCESVHSGYGAVDVVCFLQHICTNLIACSETNCGDIPLGLTCKSLFILK